MDSWPEMCRCAKTKFCTLKVLLLTVAVVCVINAKLRNLIDFRFPREALKIEYTIEFLINLVYEVRRITGDMKVNLCVSKIRMFLS
jgi:hypothetical protein